MIRELLQNGARCDLVNMSRWGKNVTQICHF